MAFVNEIPSAEDIEKYDLPYRRDLEVPVEHRRSWTADRERGVYLIGPGMTGNQAFEDDVKMCVDLYLKDSKFTVIMEPRKTSGKFSARPYCVHWPDLISIWAILPRENSMVEVPRVAREQPDTPQPLLNNYSYNEFVTILKEALIARKMGDSNKRIQAPVTVSFGF